MLAPLYQLRLGASASQVESSSGVAEALALVKRLEEQLLAKQAGEAVTAHEAPAAKRSPSKPLAALPALPPDDATLAPPPLRPPTPEASDDEEDEDDRSAEACLVVQPAVWAGEEGDDGYVSPTESDMWDEWFRWKAMKGEDCHWDEAGWPLDDESWENQEAYDPALTCEEAGKLMADPKCTSSSIPVPTPVRAVTFAPGSPTQLLPKATDDEEETPQKTPPPCLRRQNAELTLKTPSEASTQVWTPEPARGSDGSEVASVGPVRVNSTTHKKEYMRLVDYSVMHVLIDQQDLCVGCSTMSLFALLRSA